MTLLTKLEEGNSLVQVDVSQRIIEHPWLERTSEDHLVDSFMGKGA